MSSVYSEFGRLEEVLIGRADGFRLPLASADALILERAAQKPAEESEGLILGEPYPAHVVEEANRSLEELCTALRRWNPTMRICRADLTSAANHTPSVGNRGYSTRDVMIVLGQVLYLTPSCHRSRQTEVEDCFEDVLQLFNEDIKPAPSAKEAGGGAAGVIPAKGRRIEDLRTESYKELARMGGGDAFTAKTLETECAHFEALRARAQELDARLEGERASVTDLGQSELPPPGYFSRDLPKTDEEVAMHDASGVTNGVPIFDAANLLVVDHTALLYLVSVSGNLHGLVHLKEALWFGRGRRGEQRMVVHPVLDVYRGTHIDTTICILNRRTVMFCSERITRQQCYDLLSPLGPWKDKEKNYLEVTREDVTDVGLFNERQNVASVFIGMNCLALSEECVAVEASQDKLAAKLLQDSQRTGIREVVKVSFPHMRSMGGGLHCTTLPLSRASCC